MRIITQFGFGEANVEGGSLSGQKVMVNLDEPFQGQSQIGLWEGECFLFSDWVIVKVLNVAGHGVFSNLQFYASKADAEALLALPTPPDETIFLIDLQSGGFKTNHPLVGLSVQFQYSFFMRPWLDRWAEERTETFNLISEARKKFRNEVESIAGAVGISSLIHFDRYSENVLGFCLVVPPPQGVIFKKEFEFKLHEDS